MPAGVARAAALGQKRCARAGMLLVTGGAGFIGSNVVASLNEAGRSDIAVNDFIGHDDEKWRNLRKRQIADVVPPAELMAWLDGRKLDTLIHMGAISDTTATDGDPRAFHLCVVGSDLWRRRARLQR
jgi:nucleoside-diphosphate-sugar epimerase